MQVECKVVFTKQDLEGLALDKLLKGKNLTGKDYTTICDWLIHNDEKVLLSVIIKLNNGIEIDAILR